MTIQSVNDIMETKKGVFVSDMKDKIIEASIESLRKEGLKFSVDSLAAKLKVSKKTIYQYFPDKETLALALYETYYDHAIKQAETLLESNQTSDRAALLYLYFDSKMIIRDEIFNKYKLNQTIYSYAAKRNDQLWSLISAPFCEKKEGQDHDTLRIMIDGSFEKICRDKGKPDAVIERLVKLLC